MIHSEWTTVSWNRYMFQIVHSYSHIIFVDSMLHSVFCLLAGAETISFIGHTVQYVNSLSRQPVMWPTVCPISVGALASATKQNRQLEVKENKLITGLLNFKFIN